MVAAQIANVWQTCRKRQNTVRIFNVRNLVQIADRTLRERPGIKDQEQNWCASLEVDGWWVLNSRLHHYPQVTNWYVQIEYRSTPTVLLPAYLITAFDSANLMYMSWKDYKRSYRISLNDNQKMLHCQRLKIIVSLPKIAIETSQTFKIEKYRCILNSLVSNNQNRRAWAIVVYGWAIVEDHLLSGSQLSQQMSARTRNGMLSTSMPVPELQHLAQQRKWKLRAIRGRTSAARVRLTK